MLPSPPDGDVSRTGGTPAKPPLGLYLTGLEVLRRLRKKNFVCFFFFFLQRDLLSCLRNTARILLALYSPSPVWFFDCQPRFLDGRWTVFRDRVLVYAQGILKPTRLLIFTGFQSFDDQGCLLRGSSL